LSAAEIRAVRFKATADRVLTLSELCELVAGRVPLVIELKSHFDGDPRLVQRAAHVLATYSGPAAVMSFDPYLVETARQLAPSLTRGIVAERHYAHHEWHRMPASEKRRLALLLHGFRTQPHFVAYGVKDLPALAPLVARWVFGLPLLTWTVRSEGDLRTASRWADQMIFEGWRP
jgi:glycerophosphoryl diester phosphodiesterase